MRLRSLAVPVVLTVALTACSTAAGDAAETPEPSPTTASAIPSVTPKESPAVAQIEVPDVVGLDGETARSQLEALGFEVHGDPDGTMDVGAQVPGGGEQADFKSSVALTMVEPRVVEHTVEREDDVIYVWVSTTMNSRDAWLITRDLAQSGLPEGAYFVQFNCTEGNTDAAYNRQANGKIAIGNRGAALTGLNEGAFQSELRESATCP